MLSIFHNFYINILEKKMLKQVFPGWEVNNFEFWEREIERVERERKREKKREWKRKREREIITHQALHIKQDTKRLSCRDSDESKNIYYVKGSGYDVSAEIEGLLAAQGKQKSNNSLSDTLKTLFT